MSRGAWSRRPLVCNQKVKAGAQIFSMSLAKQGKKTEVERRKRHCGWFTLRLAASKRSSRLYLHVLVPAQEPELCNRDVCMVNF